MKRRILLVGLASTLAHAAHVNAQETAPPDGPVAAAETGGIEEIVVTAQRRSENLQDVPVTVAALPSDTLSKIDVRDVVSLTTVVPALKLQNTNGYLTGSIRGVGGNSVGPGYENQVALYVDDVYIGAPASSILSFNNIQQVDVLKGPQGTLFGRNATAGVIQITTREPTQELSGSAKVTYGNYHDIAGDLYIAGGLSDGIRADLSLHARTQDEGYGHRLDAALEPVGDIMRLIHDLGVRSKVVIEPTATTRITVIGEYIDTKNSYTTVPTPGTVNGFTGQVNPDFGYSTPFDGPAEFGGWAGGGSIKLEQEIGALELFSLTSYRKAHSVFYFDFDRTLLPAAHIFADQFDRQFSQEVQLRSGSGGALRWIVGAFYYKARGDWNDFLLARVGSTNIVVDDTQKTDSFAVFGQATYEILPDTNLTLGARYTWDKKSEVDGSTTIVVNASGAVAAFVPVPNRSEKTAEPTFRVSLDHRFSPELMVYASLNTGYKSGGYNIGAPGSPSFGPEKLTAYEVGLKSDLFDRRVRFNMSGFYNDYRNIQVQQLLGTSVGVTNGGTARTYGIEADLTAQLTDDLRLTNSVTWLDAKFKDFTGCLLVPAGGGQPANPNGDCSGNRIPLSSEFSGSTIIDYTYDLGGGGKVNFNGNASYTTDLFYDVGENFRQKGYVLLGASAAWTNAADTLTIRLYGNNLTDRRVVSYQSISTANGNSTQNYRPPRTYGISAEYKF